MNWPGIRCLVGIEEVYIHKEFLVQRPNCLACRQHASVAPGAMYLETMQCPIPATLEVKTNHLVSVYARDTSLWG